MEHDMTTTLVTHLLDLEAQRCDAMRRGDFELLGKILHPKLIHVHAKGKVDNYETYFEGGGTHVVYQQIERSGLEVQLLGDSALMTGRQYLVAVRKDGSGTVRIDSQVLQVWSVHEGAWRQIAFQTTPLEMSVS